MTKIQAREVAQAERYLAAGFPGTAALSISALIRCAMSNKSKAELMQVAQRMGLVSLPEFVI